MAKYYDIDDVITDEEIVAVIFQKAASGLGIDPSSETDCANILLRGYFGWNSLCALQVLNQVFPKVPSKFAVAAAPVAAAASGGAPTAVAKEEEKKEEPVEESDDDMGFSLFD
ncbi:60S acidic ribosomal protein P2-like [Quercus lobata]|uniref:60S acidic ribosomal protein P2-like n=1 Tax=Quercus lobata TaxID=97700 RepID=UPI001248745D|nr:60S acidic ribosomal protein P2-like [Quercus lobata]